MSKMGTVLMVFQLLIYSNAASQFRGFKNHNLADGLPSNTVYQTFQDSQGLLWLATEDGVSRYDGYQYTNYTRSDGLSDSEVFQFYEDHQGRIWLLTLSGRFSFYHQGRFHNSKTNPELRGLDAHSMVTSIREDRRGNLWFTTYAGSLLKYDPEKGVSSFFNGGRFGAIHKIFFLDTEGFLIFSRKGIFKIQALEGRSINQWVVRKIPFYRKTLGLFLKAIQITKSHLLFTLRDKVYRYDLTNDQTELFYQSPDQAIVNNLYLDSESDLWICTSLGVIKHNLLTGKKLPKVILKGLDVSSALKDREGNNWISTLGQGIYFSTGLPIFNYDEQYIPGMTMVSSLSKDENGHIILGMSDGNVLFLKGGIFKKQHLKYPYQYNPRVYKTLFSDGYYYICTPETLFIKNDKVEKINIGMKDILEHPKNKFWLATSFGLFSSGRNELHELIPGKELFNFYDQHQVLPHRINKVFMDGPDQILAATNEDLLSIQGIKSHFPKVEPLGLGLRVVDFCRLEDSTMLLATKEEGLIFKSPEKTFRLTEKDGLPSNNCSSLYVQEGIIWLGTNKGLCKIQRLDTTWDIVSFTAYDGLGSNVVNDILVLKDTVWIATKKGLSYFHNHLSKKRSPPIDTHLFNIWVKGEKIDPFDNQQGIILENKQNNIKVAYAGLSFQNKGQITYRYKLSENAAWQETKSTSIEFSSLSAGNYTFSVAAKVPNSGWGPTASFGFVIKEVFWKTWSFQAMVTMSIVLLAWLLSWHYFKRKRDKNKLKYQLLMAELKTLRAQINPHFMFNALNSIQLFLKERKSDEASHYLNNFAKLMRLILDHSSEADISIKQEVEALTYYLELERLRSQGKFDFNIYIDPNIDEYNTEIPAMVLQPFVENAIWHGLVPKRSRGKLKVCFIKESKSVIISVIDNGIGRLKSMQLNKGKKDSKGIKLIEERLKLLNKSKTEKVLLHIEDLTPLDEEGDCTKVMLTIPE